MTQSSLFWTTSGNGDGTVAGYSPEQIWTLLRALFGGDGVALDYLSELAASLASGTVTVAPGAALVSGIPYTADANVTISIPSPTAQSRYDYVALRASWQAQTVRAARVAGTEGVLSAPTLTQQRGGIYEIPLALIGVGCIRTISANTAINTTIYIESLEVATGYSLEIASGASVVIEAISGLTDARSFLQAVRSVTETHLAASAVTTAKLADNAVSNAKLLDMAAATVLGRVSSGSGDPEAVTMAQLIALLATTTPDRLIDAATTLSANWTVEWIEVANGYSLELANDVALTLADGGWSGFDADTVDGSQAAALALRSHTHSGYSPAAHTHSGYAATSHTHDYAPASHTHSAYSPAAHTHSDYAAAAHSHAAADIADNAVANSDLADMAAATVKGRARNAGTGDPDDLTAAQVVDMLITLNGVADGIDADLLDDMHASELAAATHTHSGYATPTHTHSGYAAADHEHTGVTSRTLTIAEDVWSGSIKEAIWQDVVFFSGTLAIDSGGAPLANSAFITGYVPAVPVYPLNIGVGLSDAGNWIQFYYNSLGLYIVAANNFTDGDTLRFSTVYLTT